MKTLVKETGNHIDMVGTCKRGEVAATLDEIIKAFGMPTMGGPEDKVTKQWDIKFEDDSLATIYDWKVPYPNDGSEYQWTIGGNSIDSAINVWAELKAIKDKQFTATNYTYISIDDLQLKIAESTGYPVVTKWCDSLTMSEGILLSAIDDNYAVTKEFNTWQEVLTLGALREAIDSHVVKKWDVACEIDYEAEVDLGVAGYVMVYGNDTEVNVDVHAKTEKEAKSLAVELLKDEYAIDSAEAIHAMEIK